MTQYFYPKGYQFTSEDLQVYRNAVRLAYVSDCQPLAEVILTLSRSAIGTDQSHWIGGFAEAYYQINQTVPPYSRVQSQFDWFLAELKDRSLP